MDPRLRGDDKVRDKGLGSKRTGRNANLSDFDYSLPKDESRIAAYDSLSVMDSICNLLKLLHMVV